MKIAKSKHTPRWTKKICEIKKNETSKQENGWKMFPFLLLIISSLSMIHIIDIFYEIDGVCLVV